MKKLILLIALAVGAWHMFNQSQQESIPAADVEESVSDSKVSAFEMQGAKEAAPTQTFKCDGRTHCSQMTSCEEATFFIRNCPDTKMDGDNDGVPCEMQHCKR